MPQRKKPAVRRVFFTVAGAGARLPRSALRCHVVGGDGADTHAIDDADVAQRDVAVPGFVLGTWHGVLAPAGTPAAIIQKLNTDINTIIQTAEFKSALETQGNVAAQPVSPAQFGARLDADMRAFEAVAAKIDLSAN